ncbi:MAG: glycosyltransferase family 4 protein [Sulfobacillus sp.]|nr:glycosyltransferase family 4 protein [Sulfobacillus sp.]
MSEPLRITFILPGYPSVPIGGFRVVYQYANELVNRGHHVSVVHAGDLRQHPGIRGIRPWPKRWVARFRLLRDSRFPRPVQWQHVDRRVKMIYLDQEPISSKVPSGDIVVATSWETAEYVAEYPASVGKKFYLIQHLETWSGQLDRILATWQMPLHLIVIAGWLLDEAKKAGRGDAVHIPNGLDHDRFYLSVDPRKRPFSVLTMYHPWAWKGFDDALAVILKLHESHPQVPVTVFGAYPRPASLPAWVPYVENPAQEQLRALYNQHAVFLHASWREGWALPPAEAMACGAVFIGTDSLGCRDYAIDGVNALLSPPRAIDALWENLRRVQDDPKLRWQLAEQGLQDIKRFTWSHSAALFEERLKEGINRTLPVES